MLKNNFLIKPLKAQIWSAENMQIIYNKTSKIYKKLSTNRSADRTRVKNKILKNFANVFSVMIGEADLKIVCLLKLALKWNKEKTNTNREYKQKNYPNKQHRPVPHQSATKPNNTLTGIQQSCGCQLWPSVGIQSFGVILRKS